MGDEKIKLAIGFILYNQSTAKYLPYFLPSISSQSYKNFRLMAVDNSDMPVDKESQTKFEYFWIDGNIGFARAYNIMIRKAAEQGVKYFLVTNVDVIYEQDAIEKLVNALQADEKLGSVCPKLMRWDFPKNKKTNIIDTCGIKLSSGLRFRDTGQGSVDNKQCETDIVGPSGASALYRISALKQVKVDDKYFDELMFMYKEDCDLAYRLKLAGYSSKCVTDAVAYHDRTAVAIGEKNIQKALNRKNKSKQIKEWSFLNQLIIYKKFWRKQSIISKFKILLQLFKMIVFISIFERFQFKQIKKYNQIKSKIILFK